MRLFVLADEYLYVGGGGSTSPRSPLPPNQMSPRSSMAPVESESPELQSYKLNREVVSIRLVLKLMYTMVGSFLNVRGIKKALLMSIMPLLKVQFLFSARIVCIFILKPPPFDH